MLLRAPSSPTATKMTGLSMNHLSLRRDRAARSILDEGGREAGHRGGKIRIWGKAKKRKAAHAPKRFFSPPVAPRAARAARPPPIPPPPPPPRHISPPPSPPPGGPISRPVPRLLVELGRHWRRSRLSQVPPRRRSRRCRRRQRPMSDPGDCRRRAERGPLESRLRSKQPTWMHPSRRPSRTQVHLSPPIGEQPRRRATNDTCVRISLSRRMPTVSTQAESELPEFVSTRFALPCFEPPYAVLRMFDRETLQPLALDQ